MIHLRIVSPPDRTDAVRDVLTNTPSVINVVVLPGVAERPDGDLVLCDVAREDASVILHDLKDLRVHEDGSISLVLIDSAISRAADEAERYAPGAPADAVVWEEVEQNTNESVELSGVFVTFMVLAAILSAVAIFGDSSVLLIGAMVVGPEFGPLAGLCVALVQERRSLAMRSAAALAVGFPLAIASTFVLTAVFKDTSLTPDEWVSSEHSLGPPDLRPRHVRGDRRARGRRGRDALAQHRQVGRADRGADLGHDPARGREHRHRGRLRRLGRLPRQPRSSSR